MSVSASVSSGWCLAAWELQPSVPVPRYCTALPAELGGRYGTTTTQPAEQERSGGESDPGPWIPTPVWHACTPASLGAALCPSCSNDHPPVLGPCCEENADGDLLSNPSPCRRPTSYTYTLLSPCMQISASLLLSSSPSTRHPPFIHPSSLPNQSFQTAISLS